MPQALADWLGLESRDWQPSYPFPHGVRRPVVEALLEAQRGLCVYCGRRLDLSQSGGSWHIEHFRPRGSFPDLATDFANLFLSCGPMTDAGRPSETCGNAKDDWFDGTDCVQPDYPDCTNRFRFLLNGQAEPASDGDSAALRMIEVLNLNHRELSKDRRDILDQIDGGTLDLFDFIDRAGGEAQSYAHVVCQRFGKVIP